MSPLAAAPTPGMKLLPDDYHREVAREIVEFFHTFYRFGAPTNVFNLENPTYQQFLHNILFGSLIIGTIVFVILCIIVVRRCFLHIRSAYARRVPMESQTLEIAAVILLTFIAISSLSGLLGEAQVDYSARVVRDVMTNTSDWFHDAQSIAAHSVATSETIRGRADNMVVSFNESDLPENAFKLSVEALRLLHSAKDLANQTNSLLPSNYADIAKDWEFSYFMLKSTTNVAILMVALASFMSMSSIGWSMVSPLRVSILVILSIVPISHTLIGVYLSSTIMTADFCAVPVNSTMTLLHTNAAVNYFLECPVNTSSPFVETAQSVEATAQFVSSLQQNLEDYAAHHGAAGVRMKNEFLDPIGKDLDEIDALLVAFNGTQTCQNISHGFAHAVSAYCEYGILGFFSMWVHQILLCIILFVGVITSVLVYERVQMRELRMDVRYQLLSTYEEDDMEHVYLSND